jgi:hypothetical protein
MIRVARGIGEIIVDAIFGILLLLLLVDGLIANWTWNPFYDMLIVKVQGPIFQGVHASSILAMCFVCIYQIAKTWRTIAPARWIAVIFATGSIHEFSIQIWNNILSKNLAGDFGITYAIWLSVFLAIGVVIATKRQRKILGILAIYLFLLMGAYVGFFHDSSTQTFASGPSFVYDSFIEVFGWVSAALVWMLA